MSYENLTVNRNGTIATVTFNRPDKANALNSDHLHDIEAVALSFRDDADTRVVIFTGAGKHFSSGADLTDPGVGPQPIVQRRRSMRIGQRAIMAICDMDQVTIAAWNGAAMGGGACLTTAMDFRVGADNCFMAYPEVNIGVNLMWQSLPLITHLAGPARAKRLVMGGEHITANTLMQWGILDELVPLKELLPKAQQLARFYASKPPVACQMIKRSINAISNALDQSIMHMDFDQNMLNTFTEDRKEAIDAYLNKREPVFTGK